MVQRALAAEDLAASRRTPLIAALPKILYGILGPANQEYNALGININLWWGLFMVFFGCVVLGMSFTSPRRRANQEAARGSGRDSS